MGVAEHGSAPFCPSCTGLVGQGCLGSCSRLAAGLEQTEVSLICISDARILETLQTV